jgi:hypothetical protein
MKNSTRNVKDYDKLYLQFISFTISYYFQIIFEIIFHIIFKKEIGKYALNSYGASGLFQ